MKEEHDNYREKADQAALELERKLSAATRKLEDRERKLAVIDKEHGRVRDRLSAELNKVTEQVSGQVGCKYTRSIPKLSYSRCVCFLSQASALRQCLLHTVEQLYVATQGDAADPHDPAELSPPTTVMIDPDEILVPTSIGMSAIEVSDILSAVQPPSRPKSRQRAPELPTSKVAKQRSAHSTFMEGLTRLVTDRVDLSGVHDLVNTLLR